MRRLQISVLLGFILLSACQKSEIISEFTGNEVTYDLQPGSTYSVSGTVTFKERKDGAIAAIIQLSGTDGDVQHPVHLHMGDLSSPGADISLLLNPVLGESGRSETTFSNLADESPIGYAELTQLPACIKIHLGSTGANRDIILAAGNIGVSFTKASPNSRTGIAVCKSE